MQTGQHGIRGSHRILTNSKIEDWKIAKPHSLLACLTKQRRTLPSELGSKRHCVRSYMYVHPCIRLLYESAILTMLQIDSPVVSLLRQLPSSH